MFEVSKAASGQLPVSLKRLDLARLLRQTLADMDQPIQESGLQLRTQLPDHSVLIQGDSDRLYRVFQNLLGNALKYSLAGSRVYLTLTVEEGQAVAALRNTSAAELRPGLDYTQRFVRGDESRTDGGSGLGLSIASSFVQACGGQFQVETQADLFTALVSFPLDASPSDPRGSAFRKQPYGRTFLTNGKAQALLRLGPLCQWGYGPSARTGRRAASSV